MSTFDRAALRVFVVRPGQTELDEQGRIAGNLDIPLSENGREQISELCQHFASVKIDRIVCGPGDASVETASILNPQGQIKVKVEDDLRNLDYGLWHGRRIDELKETQPKLFKMWQEQPESICPPDGETVEQICHRVQKFAKKLTKKNRAENVIVVAAEPVACILRSVLESVDLAEYWTVESNCGSWFEITRSFQAV